MGPPVSSKGASQSQDEDRHARLARLTKGQAGQGVACLAESWCWLGAALAWLSLR